MALYASKQGDKVLATVRTHDRFPPELKELGAHPLVLSLESSDEDIESVAKEALSVYGHVDVLVNNAGTLAGGYGPIEELPMNDLRKHFQVNYFSQIAFTRPFIAHFRTRRSGCIINISTMASLGGAPSCSPYTGAKAALDAASISLRAELKPFNVRVYDVLPGVFPSKIKYSSPVWTDDVDNRGDDAVAALSKVYTDPSQGYDIVNRALHPKERGDPEIFGRRVYEIVAEVGLAREVMGNYDDHPEWVRVPMGGDATSQMHQKAMEIAANVKAYEALSRSTDAAVEGEGTKVPTTLTPARRWWSRMLHALF